MSIIETGKAEDKINKLRNALVALIDRYTGLVNSGDCGFWDPEKDETIIAARTALSETA